MWLLFGPLMMLYVAATLLHVVEWVFPFSSVLYLYSYLSTYLFVAFLCKSYRLIYTHDYSTFSLLNLLWCVSVAVAIATVFRSYFMCNHDFVIIFPCVCGGLIGGLLATSSTGIWVIGCLQFISIFLSMKWIYVGCNWTLVTC